MRISRKHIRIISFCLAAVFALPVSFGKFTGLYLWSSPLILINTLLSQHTFNLLGILAVTVFLLGFWKHRWYCKWICPVGLLCDGVSKKSVFNIKASRIPEFGPFLVIAGLFLAVLGIPIINLLDPMTLFHSFWDAFRAQPFGVVVLKILGLVIVVAINLFIPHIWCSRICPLGGLQDIQTSVRKFFAQKENRKFAPHKDRRLVMGILAAFGVKLALPKFVHPAKASIRPPGALPYEQLVTACLRCGSCGKSCPSDIIRSSLDPHNPAGLLTPYVQFEPGHCLPECTACGDVCPSNAIQKFSLKDKQTLYMAIVSINIEKCLLAEHKECDLCNRYCAYKAVEIRVSDSDLSAWPEVSTNRCVGCGACVVVCPTRAIDIFPKQNEVKAKIGKTVL